MLRKTIAIVLSVQAIGIFLVLSNLNLFNSNSPLENSIASLGAAMFWLAPIVGLVVLLGQKSRVRRGRAIQWRAILLLAIKFIALVVSVWLLVWFADWSYAAIRGGIDAEEMRQSQIRSEEYSNSIGKAREEKWARTCLTVHTLSTDLQVSALYYDYQDAKIYLQQHASSETLNEVNEHVQAINTKFHQCEDGSVTPTEQRNAIKIHLQKIISLADTK